jgi:PPOX class probable F420-dependent enzyme
MAAQIPREYLDLLEKPAFAHLATVMPDGTPQVTPVWIDFDGTYLLVNTAAGRQKDKNMTARAQVGIELSDPANPYRYLSVRGRVVEMIEDGADAHIDKLAKKYLGLDSYPYRSATETRRIYKIEPLRVQAQTQG